MNLEVMKKKEIRNLKMLDINSNLMMRNAEQSESKAKAIEKLKKMDRLQSEQRKQQKL